MPPVTQPRPQVGNVKRILLIVLSVVLAFTAYAAVVRPATAQEQREICAPGAGGYMSFQVHSDQGLQAVLGSLPAPPDGLTSSFSGSTVTFSGEAPASCGENQLSPVQARAIGWAIYVGVAVATGAAMMAFPPLVEYIPAVAGTLAGAVSSYVQTGLEDGEWGRPALEAAAFSAFQNLVAGSLLRAMVPELREAIFGAMGRLVNAFLGGAWVQWLLRTWFDMVAREAGPVAAAIEMGVLRAAGPAAQ